MTGHSRERAHWWADRAHVIVSKWNKGLMCDCEDGRVVARLQLVTEQEMCASVMILRLECVGLIRTRKRLEIEVDFRELDFLRCQVRVVTQQKQSGCAVTGNFGSTYQLVALKTRQCVWSSFLGNPVKVDERHFVAYSNLDDTLRVFSTDDFDTPCRVFCYDDTDTEYTVRNGMIAFRSKEHIDLVDAVTGLWLWRLPVSSPLDFSLSSF
ncbi:hypothetical protein Pelo_16059 [Pelomyxa schiedti]|nr:hypothetical protein Pelo_16059 [Pelomyxa schiedti]